MKKAQLNDDLRSGYDFASMSGGVRGRYAKSVCESANVVLLEPEVAKAFPNEAAVNKALRGILKATPPAQQASKLPGKSRQLLKRRKKTGTRD